MAGEHPPHYYPVFLDLRDRLCVVVGGGRVALEKVQGLLPTGAHIRLIAQELDSELEALLHDKPIEHLNRSFAQGDLDGASLVIAEQIDDETHRALAEECESRKLFLNIQDKVPYCSFVAPSIVRRGHLAVAISTAGVAPALSVRLRQRLERELGPEYADFLDLAWNCRSSLAPAIDDFEERRRRWYELVDSEILDLLRQGSKEKAEQLAAEIWKVDRPMAKDDSRLTHALDSFDAANREDPHRESSGGQDLPKELLYAQRMSQRLEALAPDASDALKLAIRCQHLERWKIPRGDFPAGRRGYLDWRNACKKMHAERAGDILRHVGYDEETIERVSDLVQKRRLKADPEAQLLEDVACLVFLEHYLPDFAAAHEEDKVLDILKKTWRKMSPSGQDAALSLDLPETARQLIDRALRSDS